MLTPEYTSVLVLDRVWVLQIYEIEIRSLSLSNISQAACLKKTFSSVRARDEHDCVLWELHDIQTVSTEDIYASTGCTVEFLHADFKYSSHIPTF